MQVRFTHIPSPIRLAGAGFFILLFASFAAFGQNAASSAGGIKTRKKPVVRRPAAKPVDVAPEITYVRTVTPSSSDRDLRTYPRQGPTKAQRNRPKIEFEAPPIGKKKPLPGVVDPPYQRQEQPSSPLMPAPSQTFVGLDAATWGAGFPPDTVGDVGPNNFIQAVNTSFGIYNKTGTQLAAMTFDTFWAGHAPGTPCEGLNEGDPTVIYDPLHGRWIVADFAFGFVGNTPVAPYYECIAVSKTSDPVAGGWWYFPVRTDDATHPWLADYPKMGIWRDGLYMSANMFNSAGTFQEVRNWAFNITDLINGNALGTIIVDTGSTTYFSMLPANFRGAPPPVGREEFFVTESQTLFAFHVFKFHADFAVPANSTFLGPTNVSQTSYTVAPATAPSSGNSLDTLRERLMMQAQYRAVGATESLWVNHTVRTGASPAPAGIQWAQINITGGTIVATPVQQQIYGNLSADGVYRWMGALAVDIAGNMAIGYSTSKAATNPGISYNGRLSGDALNTLPQGEVVLHAGGGSQTGLCGGATCTRWGDYSAMSVDPSDNCTFWYTTQYYAASGGNWQTRIGAFKFPSCTPTAAAVAVSGRVVDENGNGIPNVRVTLGDLDGSSRLAITNGFGYYRFDAVETGRTYSVNVSHKRYEFSEPTRMISVVEELVDVNFVSLP